ncbi:hypothetical protein BJ546DRAFT_948261 [Cryomyces antarcticus]
MLNHVWRWLRPRLQPGMRREEWTCECGEVLWADVAENDAESAAYIQSLRDQERGDGSGAANSHHRSPGRGGSRAGQDENDNGASVAPHLTDTTSSTCSPNSWGRSFFALCADKSLSRIEFLEVETTTLRTDGELVEDEDQEAGVYNGPFTVPPVEMVSVGIYHYDPVPLGTVPVFGKHFVHNLLYGHANPKLPIHRTNRLLKRIPKKLKTSLNEEASKRPNETAVGYGCYVVEGPNRWGRLWLCVGVVIALITVAACYDGISSSLVTGSGLSSLLLGMFAIFL